MSVVRNHKVLSESQCDKKFLRLFDKPVVLDMVTKINYLALSVEEQQINKDGKLQRLVYKQ